MAHTPESISKIVFGNSHRASVWGAVAKRTIFPPEEFLRADIENETNAGVRKSVGVSTVFRELGILEDLDMIEREDAPHGSRVRYRRVEHPLWPVVEAATLAIDQLLGMQDN